MSLGIAGSSQQTSGTSQNTGSQNVTSSGSTSKVLTPYQSALQAPLFQTISNLMTNPMATVAPLVTQAKNNITNSFSGAAQQLRQQFMGTTAGGGSGKYGTGQLQTNLNQQGQLANADVSGAATAAQLPLQAAGIGTQLLGQVNGQTNTGNVAGTTSSSGSTTGTESGSGYNAGLGSGQGSLANSLVSAIF